MSPYIAATGSSLVFCLSSCHPTVYSQHSSQSDCIQTQARPCPSSAQNPELAPISCRVKAQVLAMACKALYVIWCNHLSNYLPNTLSLALSQSVTEASLPFHKPAGTCPPWGFCSGCLCWNAPPLDVSSVNSFMSFKSSLLNEVYSDYSAVQPVPLLSATLNPSPSAFLLFSVILKTFKRII